MNMNLEKVCWMPMVVDMDTATQFLGSDRLAPYGWLYGIHRKHMESIGGWDEEYMKGLAFDDNDIMARLALEVGRFVIDGNCTVWHQSHPQVAYSDNMKGFNINKDYTLKKWGFIPWGKGCKMRKTTTEVNNQLVLDVKSQESLVA